MNKRQHYCHQCGAQIANPEREGVEVNCNSQIFYILTCEKCNTEHEFIEEYGELQCHSTIQNGLRK